MKKDSDVMVQGRWYNPTNSLNIETKNCDDKNRPVGSNPNGIRDPHAFCKIPLQLAKEGLLHDKKTGKLLTENDILG